MVCVVFNGVVSFLNDSKMTHEIPDVHWENDILWKKCVSF